MGRMKVGSRGLELVLLGLVVSVLMQAPESPREPSADGFSLQRAKSTLAQLAEQPRPRGSKQHAAVAQLLQDEFRSMGVHVETQAGKFDPANLVSERASGDDRGVSEDGQLLNIIASIKGSASSGTILLMAHYDSVKGSPGAGDDASGCVAVLEAMRALAGAAPRNDVIALLTDGEEEGLRGARLFADEHERFGEVDLVLNFESIGNGGPALMFESGPGSGGLIDLWLRDAPEPRGNTLAPVIYGWLPNDTDFSIFRDAGIRGLNFAVAGGSGAYHQPSDRAERFDDQSLAHMSRTAIALSSSLSQVDLRQLKAGSRTFDSQPLLGAQSWNGRLHVWLTLAMIGAWALWVWRRVGLSAAGFLRGALMGMLSAGLAGLAAFGMPAIWLALNTPDLPISYQGIHLLLAAMIACSVVATIFSALLWGSRKQDRLRAVLSASPLIWVLIFAFFAVVDMQHMGASYPIAWAAACACAASMLRTAGRAPVIAALALLPAIFQVGPILGQLVQLSSQDIHVTLWQGAILIGLGILMVLPVFGGKVEA